MHIWRELRKWVVSSSYTKVAARCRFNKNNKKSIFGFWHVSRHVFWCFFFDKLNRFENHVIAFLVLLYVRDVHRSPPKGVLKMYDATQDKKTLSPPPTFFLQKKFGAICFFTNKFQLFFLKLLRSHRRKIIQAGQKPKQEHPSASASCARLCSMLKTKRNIFASFLSTCRRFDLCKNVEVVLSFPQFHTVSIKVYVRWGLFNDPFN